MENSAQAMHEMQERANSRTAKLRAQLDDLRKQHDDLRDVLAKELEDSQALELKANRSGDDSCGSDGAEDEPRVFRAVDNGTIDDL